MKLAVILLSIIVNKFKKKMPNLTDNFALGTSLFGDKYLPKHLP